MGVLLIDARGVGFDNQLAQLWNSLKAFFVGLFVVVLILGLGGPTGETPGTAVSYTWLVICSYTTVTMILAGSGSR